MRSKNSNGFACLDENTGFPYDKQDRNDSGLQGIRMAVMRTAAKISRQPIGRWDMGGNKMIAITACAAALAAVTVGLLLRSEYEKTFCDRPV